MRGAYDCGAGYHSQWGEDEWLDAHGMLPATGVFVDVGAGDGRRGSNTLALERRGWRGLCVEPDSRHWPVLRTRDCALARVAVDEVAGYRLLHLHARPTRSSLLAVPAVRTRIVRCERLDTLLQQSGIGRIDLLSIDTEGTELAVWRSFDAMVHRPSLVIVEYEESRQGRRAEDLCGVIGERYALVRRTPSNLILVRRGVPAVYLAALSRADG
jgi:FkbM family methyltransferase